MLLNSFGQSLGRLVPVTIHRSKEIVINFGHRIKKQVAAAYPTVKTTLSFTTTYAFREIAKESLATTTKISVIYYFTCACEAMYVGKTTRRLTERITQHIPDWISNNGMKKQILPSQRI